MKNNGFEIIKKILVAGLVLFSLSGYAFAQTSVNDKAQTKTKMRAKKPKNIDESKSSNPTLNSITGGGSGWRLQGALTHVPKTRNDNEDTTDILARADYTFNNKHRVRLQQVWTKFYGKYSSEYEFKAYDTQIGHYYTMGSKPWGVNLLWKNHANVPISNESNRDDLITRFQSTLIGTKAFLKGKLIAFGTPYARYSWYEFKNSKSGRPLPLFDLGASLAGLYFITPQLSFYAGLTYEYQTVSNSQYDTSPSQPNRGIYQWDLSLTYQFTNALSSSLGYFQGASYIQDGRYEFAFYDNEVSRYSLGLTYIY
ncbi:MAG: hypothetical protein KDD33_09895 [Bdellovibrionales bacterium]|nr:hypothetical protein [Bdellovibrionales bacterium]